MLLTCLVGAAILAGLGAAPAGAAEKGVHFDPGSPAGTEYALPLSQARNEASGKSGVAKDGSVEPAPLFGQGVGGPGGSTGAESRSGAGTGGAQRTGNGRDANPGGENGGPTPREGSPTAIGGRLPTDTEYSPDGALLIGALILVAAAGAGYGLRRASGPRSA